MQCHSFSQLAAHGRVSLTVKSDQTLLAINNLAWSVEFFFESLLPECSSRKKQNWWPSRNSFLSFRWEAQPITLSLYCKPVHRLFLCDSTERWDSKLIATLIPHMNRIEALQPVIIFLPRNEARQSFATLLLIPPTVYSRDYNSNGSSPTITVYTSHLFPIVLPHPRLRNRPSLSLPN